ncbi:MAG TPA: FtsK/SpoIIIE domain-containing protein [Jatrophihabitans sp.]|jgi:S-DNA-T family DNA segregation ATPase FtsK/SpoIIIE
MQVHLTVRTSEGIDADIEIDAAATTSAAELRPLLTEFTGHPASATIATPDGPLPADRTLGGPGLRSGAVLTIGAAGRRSGPGTSLLQLRVVGGPDVGLIRSLQRGVVSIGRDAANDLAIADPDISRLHAELRVSEDGIEIRDCGSTNGTAVIPDGAPADDAVGRQWRQVRIGALIRLGHSLITAVPIADPPAACRPAPDGTTVVSPIRSSLPLQLAAPIEFPVQPDDEPRPPTQWLAVLLPTVLSAALAILMRNPQFLAFSLLTPIAMLATTLSDRRGLRRGTRRDRANHVLAEAAAHDMLAVRLAEEAVQRRARYPDLAAIAQSTAGPDSRLWERRRGEQDFLSVRLGTADQPATCTASRGGAEMNVEVGSVPATIDLRRGSLSLSGPEAVTGRIAASLICQVLTLHAPSDVTVIALVGMPGSHWRWLRWLAQVTTIARRPDEQRAVVEVLMSTIQDRREATGPAPTDGASWNGSWIVLLVESDVISSDLPGLAEVISSGPELGVTAICLTDAAGMVNATVRATAHVRAETGSHLELTSPEGPNTTIVADQVSPVFTERVARNLAPLRDGRSDSAAAIPDRVRLTELFPHSITNPDLLVKQWESSSGLTAPIGRAAAGTMSLDLVGDGPHLLIAGSTGAGKSELLRCLVAGLAASHAPADVSFVLIDYKGGAAFAECADLPHTLGVVTDLDSHLTRRALISLDAELRRRERLFAAAHATDLTSYQATPQAKVRPVARLVLIVDEFASLVEELPAFVTGLVGIAQRGRSLGVHLVLATQRPAGVVSAEIRANVAARIALRVVDPGDSADVIATVAAARIDKKLPGRAIGVLGGRPVEFQTAQVGLPVLPERSTSLRLLDEWNRPLEAPDDQYSAKTDLQLLRDATLEAAHRLGRPAPQRPWLPPLPDRLTVSELADERQGNDSTVRFGVVDDPDEQGQYSLTHDLNLGGSIGVIGAPRSGRTTVLRTVLATAAERFSAGELHLYVVDCAGGSLLPIAELPHCGAVVTRDDPGAVQTLFTRLSQDCARRRARLAQLGVSSVAEARLVGESIPAVMVVIDNWEGLTELSDGADAGRTVDTSLAMLRECAAVGYTVIVAGGRELLGTRTTSVLGRRYLLELLDRNDYGMAGLRSDAIPVTFVPGRAVTADTGLEVQFALLDAEPNPTPQSESAVQTRAVRQLARSQIPSGGPLPMVIRSLPTRITANQLDVEATGDAGRRGPAESGVILGAGGDDGHPVRVDVFADDGRFLIAGPSRSGRSTAALAITDGVHRAGHQVVVVARDSSPLNCWALSNAVTVIDPTTAKEPDASHVARITDGLVVVDDCELVTDSPLEEALSRIIAARSSAVLVTARSDDLLVSFRGIAFEMRRSRTGLLLQPNITDGEPFGIVITNVTAARQSPLPGRGVLITDALRLTDPNGIPIQVVADAC